MSIVNVNELNLYCNNFEDSDDAIALKEQLLQSAQEVVERYLGYKLAEDDFEEEFSTVGPKGVYLSNRPVVDVRKVVINNTTLDRSKFNWTEERVYFTDKYCKNSEVSIKYTAGSRKQPALIKTTILRIAALMLQETNGNIGLSGKTLSETSRTFINYSNYDKYLRPLYGYKVFSL